MALPARAADISIALVRWQLRLSIVGFAEKAFPFKNPQTTKSKALRLEECEAHEMIAFSLMCHSQFSEHSPVVSSSDVSQKTSVLLKVHRWIS